MPPRPIAERPLPAATSRRSAPAEEPPVDMERLLDFTDGNPESLRELVKLYMEQTTEQFEQLKSAIS